MMQKIIHYPQLDTVLMVEKYVQKHSGEHNKKNLWLNLPKKMMYQTFCVIINYLQESGKIAQDKQNKIAWIWDPEGIQKYLKKELEWKSVKNERTKRTKNHPQTEKYL